MRYVLLWCAAAMTGWTTEASAASARSESAGTLTDGTAITAVTLSNAKGFRARILSYGATLQSMLVPDRAGVPVDVVLGYDDLDSYVRHPNFFGVSVGRYANRIAGARFHLDGREYRLPRNDGANSLHGGGRGFDTVAWKVAALKSGDVASVTLTYRSPDGDAGYPGTLDITATYSLDDAGALSILYGATTDRPTVVNLTNHSIFNLAGEGSRTSALDQLLTIHAARTTPVDANLIPTGELRPVEGTVFDFRKPRRIADGIRDGSDEQIRLGRGYDHNFVLDGGASERSKLAATLEDTVSGRRLQVFTTEPGLQLYTTNFLDGTFIGKSGHVYRMGDGVALEAQKFPDSPNRPEFPSARVDPGMPYRHLTIFRFSNAPRARPR